MLNFYERDVLCIKDRWDEGIHVFKEGETYSIEHVLVTNEEQEQWLSNALIGDEQSVVVFDIDSKDNYLNKEAVDYLETHFTLQKMSMVLDRGRSRGVSY